MSIEKNKKTSEKMINMENRRPPGLNVAKKAPANQGKEGGDYFLSMRFKDFPSAKVK